MSDQVSKERTAIVEAILHDLYQATPVGDTKFSDQLMPDIIRNLSFAESDDYLKRVETMLSKATDALAELDYWESSTQIRTLLQSLADEDNSGLKSLCAHADYLASNPTHIDRFVSMKKKLLKLLEVEPDERGFLPTIASHIACEIEFHDAEFNLGWSGTQPSYPVHVAILVERHPDHVEAVMEYIYRLQAIPNLVEFEKYLSYGVVREGVL